MAVQFLHQSDPVQLFLEGSNAAGGSFVVDRLTVATPSNRISAAVSVPGTSFPAAASDSAPVPRPWSFGVPHTTFDFGGGVLEIAGSRGAVSLQWDGLIADLSGDVLKLRFTRLHVSSPQWPQFSVAADVTLTFQNGAQPAADDVHLQIPHRSEGKLRIGSTQIRLQWTSDVLSGLQLPGVEAIVENGEVLNLVLSGATDPFGSVALLVTPKQKVVADSAFAWMRDNQRELLREQTGITPAPSVLRLTATPVNTAAPPPLLLMRLDLGAGGLPVFLQGLTVPFNATVSDNVDVSDANLKDLDAAWSVAFSTSRKFVFPFLQGTDRTIALSRFNSAEAAQTITSNRIAVAAEVQIDVGAKDAALPLQGFSFTTQAALQFVPRKFAFDVNHDAGIALTVDAAHNSQLGPRNLLGMTWLFAAVDGSSAFPGFVLATKNSQYRLKLATGTTKATTSAVTAGYFRLTHSTEAIEFDSTDFTLEEGGINLTAEVRNQPVLLFGINTRFRFHDTRLVIVDGAIQDFTLLGTGSLPPALVGNGTVEASLQFQQVGDTVKVVGGGAQLKGTQALESKAMRFRFVIDSLGLKFVDDGRYHFYFTLSGHAQFKLEPGDDPDGPLALLTQIKIPMIDVPLAGESSVLTDHVDFLSRLPSTLTFKFLKAFTFELKGFGFMPALEEFDGDPGIKFSGQMLFSSDSDEKSAKIDFHDFLLGLPADGDTFPRVFLRELAVELKAGEAFECSGAVEFIRSKTEVGFKGEGKLAIKSLPQLAASFGFLRVRKDEFSPFHPAWFFFVELDKISFQIPEIPVFLREIGFGFGYRFTLLAIKGADEEKDIRKLIGALDELSHTAGNLSSKDQWIVDLEEEGEDPRWTMVFRALFSNTSASTSPIKYEAEKEKELPCNFMFDAIVAFRSDLTFFMSARAWVAANYNDFLEDEELKSKPMMTGFVILQARKKRFLAHVASNPEGELGNHPEMPDFVKQAVKGTQYSATLLIEPGLFHLELGWPNMLRWTRAFGPVEVEFRGGFIFRAVERIRVTKEIAAGALPTSTVPGFRVTTLPSQKRQLQWDNPNANQFDVIVGDQEADPPLPGLSPDEVSKQGVRDMFPAVGNAVVSGDAFLVIGISFQARAHLEIDEGFDAAVFGAQLKASIDAAFGARMTGVTSVLRSDEVAVYAAVSLEVRAHFELILWIGLSRKLSKEFSFSLSLTITAGLEFGLTNASGVRVGLRGSGTVAVEVMGHECHFEASFEKDPNIIEDALALTNEFLLLGLDATDVTGVQPPKVIPASAPAPTPLGTVHAPGTVPLTPAPARPLTPAPVPVPIPPVLVTTAANPVAVAPKYTIFVKDGGDKGTFFLLLPKGEGETGFLPGPPTTAGVTDFQVSFPSGTGLQRIRSTFAATAGVDDQFQALTNIASVSWSANWGAAVVEDKTVGDFLDDAFLKQTITGDRSDPPNLNSLRSQTLEDDRVQNPTDTSFEAAVRGAVEQFRGSPFFKSDPANPYDQALRQAFSPDTCPYSASGGKPTGDERLMQQAIQTRGMILHELIGNFGKYVDAVKQGVSLGSLPQSLPFQLGLVFRVANGNPLPDWLAQKAGQAGDGHTVTVSQRTGKKDTLAAAQVASTFNIPSANFSLFSPKFENVRQYTSSNTIAIAWDLEWDGAPAGSAGGAQDNPEHHLINYQVRRRALDGSEPEALYTVKKARVLHREGGVLNRIQPRFQVVDHFNHETLDDQAALPTQGRSYLYTITPNDVGGNPGRPLSLIATRFPDEPPAVPAGAELTVTYHLDPLLQVLEPAAAAAPSDRRLLLSRRRTGDPGAPLAEVAWSEPSPGNGPRVPIETYRLIFRKDKTLPVGSYGLDASTQGPRSKSLPTSNARPLPTDVRVTLDPSGTRDQRSSKVDLSKVFPAGANPGWRAEGWTVYFQTESANKVPSALVPVNLLVRFTTASPIPDPNIDPASIRNEEHRPSELEFVPVPVKFPLLPPEDMQGEPGFQCVPMPVLGQPVGTVSYVRHPDGERLIRFRWNQGPAGDRRYPLDLTAGYRLLELDIDAQTNATFQEAAKLGAALRRIQEVQMLPGDDVILAPNDTRSASLWKAWYPSTVKRLTTPKTVRGSETPLTAWNSWRESELIWPEWPGFTNTTGALRPDTFHPALTAIVTALQTKGTVQVQMAPPMQPGDFDAFTRSTAPGADAYGWGVLQRVGLSITVILHRPDGTVVPGGEALQEIGKVLTSPPDALKDFLPFLFVEVLYQPAQSTSLTVGAVDPKTQLAMVQLSLRPGFRRVLQYDAAEVAGTPGDSVAVKFTLASDAVSTVVDQSDPSSGEIELSAGDTTRSFTIPSSGKLRLLLRSTIGKVPVLKTGPAGSETTISTSGFAASDMGSGYFSVPADLLAVRFADPASVPAALPANVRAAQSTAARANWQIFKRLVESLNATPAPGTPQIAIAQDFAGIQKILPQYLAWSTRFFDFSADGELPVSPATRGASTATAYPQSGTPVYVTPDAHGRLQYDHKVLDPWAHTYRYYILPFGRYDLLWQGLRQSRSLARTVRAGGARVLDDSPDPAAPALDIVLGRTRPVAAPVVLSSRRIDVPGTVASPSAPGPTWEVILQQHPEQTLMERNQTVFRQLSYRGVSFTVLRRFAFEDWMRSLPGLALATPRSTANPEPAIPGSYPDAPDHLALDALSPDDQQALAIRNRIGDLRNGAMVLHWKGLPFFYEHRMLAIAQTDSVVSSISEVIQRDFEYVSPQPRCLFHAADSSWTLSAPFDATSQSLRSMKLEIPLKRFWDCLPQSARGRWPEEEPKGTDTARRPGGLPDREVVYTILAEFNGTVESQATFLVAGTTYQGTQLGKDFLSQLDALPNPADPGSATADFLLRGSLLPITEIKLSRAFSTNNVVRAAAGPENKLLVAGILRAPDLKSLVQNNIRQDDFGNVLATVTQSPAVPDNLVGTVSYPDIPGAADVPPILKKQLVLTTRNLTWTGFMTPAQQTAVRRLNTSGLYQNMAASLIGSFELFSIDADFVQDCAAVRTNPSLYPPAISGKLTATITFTPADGRKWTLTWNGSLNSVEEASLRAQSPPTDLAWQQGITGLINKVRATVRTDIAGNTVPSTDVVIEGFSFATAATPGGPSSGRRLAWSRPNPDQLPSIRALLPDDADFQAGVNTLEQLIGQASGTVDIGFSFPMVNISSLAASVRSTQLTELVRVQSGSIRCGLGWGRVEVAPEDLLTRMRLFLEADDPFLEAFLLLAAKVAAKSRTFVYVGERSIAAAAPLSPNDTAALAQSFPAGDQTAIESLAKTLQDRQKLTAMHDGWFTTTPCSQPVTFTTAALETGLFDLQERDSCALVWRGPLSDADRAALTALGGDEGFQRALGDLKSVAVDEFSFAQAPLGLDQVPQAIRSNVAVLGDAAGNTLRQLRWKGLLSDSSVATLRRWAQIPEAGAAVNEIVRKGEQFKVSVQIQQEVPDILRGRLQIEESQIAWVGAAPTAVELTALQGLAVALARQAPLTELPPVHFEIAAFANVTGTGVTSVGSTFVRRPRQDELPDILGGQLAISDQAIVGTTPAQVTISWSGRATEKQINALNGLSGDQPFRQAIREIVTALFEFEVTVDFAPPVPGRPAQGGLPASIRDRLLIGRNQIRYHGMMNDDEIRELAGLFAAQPDKDSVERLYRASLEKGKVNRQVLIGARRANAAPATSVPLEPRPRTN